MGFRNRPHWKSCLGFGPGASHLTEPLTPTLLDVKDRALQLNRHQVLGTQQVHQ